MTHMGGEIVTGVIPQWSTPAEIRVEGKNTQGKKLKYRIRLKQLNQKQWKEAIVKNWKASRWNLWFSNCAVEAIVKNWKEGFNVELSKPVRVREAIVKNWKQSVYLA